MVLGPVMVGMLFAFVTQVLLQGWVDEKLFGDRVASEFPCELIAIARLMVDVVWIVDDLFVILLEFAMILGYGF